MINLKKKTNNDKPYKKTNYSLRVRKRSKLYEKQQKTQRTINQNENK